MDSAEFNTFSRPIQDFAEEYVPDCAVEMKPFVGQKFPTEEDGIKFYKAYGAVCGFDTRLGATKKSADGTCNTWRYVYCNREGQKHTIADERSGVDGVKKKRRVSMRTSCMARMVLKLSSCFGYVVEYFNESHNHPLLSEAAIPFLNVNRKIDFVHQKFVLDCARASIGPMKSFRLFKEFVGAYSEVGCSGVDFKNISRDMKAFIDGKDAQMVINQLYRKKELCSAYVFDYQVDAEDHLTRLFWCDPISRRNYHLFGDVVSFDATYSTNRYCMIFAPFTGKDNHGRCVTFAAGLLSKEDADSYVWLMENFKKCMGDVPRLIITDQDLGMKAAVERVLVGTRHRFCMWHIMLKVADKVPQCLKQDEDFKKELSNVVWSEEIEPENFELRWKEIMHNFGLVGNTWFESMYELRHYWIPAYFRDFPMSGLIKTTSISESENSVFGKYTRARSNLIEFFMHYDSAVDAQRHAAAHCNYVDESSKPKLETSLSIEKHVACVYSLKIFHNVQQEILSACFKCSVLSICSRDGAHEYKIDDGSHYVCTVEYSTVADTFICSCKMFVRFGLLCRHIFFVFKNVGVASIPDKYIVSRWTKKPCSKPTNCIEGFQGEQFAVLDDNRILTSKLVSEFYKCLGLVDGDIERMSELLRDIMHLYDKFGNVGSGQLMGSNKQDVMERFYGVSVPNDVSVQPPNLVKTKCSGSRLQSRKEKAIQQMNKPLRKCSKCKQMYNHDARNCGNVKNN